MPGFTVVLTPRGRGAVASLRFRGPCGVLDACEPAPLFRAANGQPVERQALRRIVFGHWGSGQATEAVVLTRLAEDELEIHCHGGDAAVQRILADLEDRGAEVQTWQAAEMARHGHLAAECTAALARAATLKSAAILLEQQSGALRRAVDELLAEAWTVEGRDKAGRRLQQLLNWGDFGLHLSEPWSVVLAGRPNAGKSSLINALVGYARSVVFDEPGTTRDVVTAETALGGWAVRLSDTAGIREGAPELEAAGIARAQAHFAAADCRVLLLDTSEAPNRDDQRLLDEWPDAIVVAHKADLPQVWHESLPDGTIAVSSKTGSGLDELMAAIVAKLVPVIPPAGTAIPVSPRQVACLAAARRELAAVDQPAYLEALRTLIG